MCDVEEEGGSRGRGRRTNGGKREEGREREMKGRKRVAIYGWQPGGESGGGNVCVRNGADDRYKDENVMLQG